MTQVVGPDAVELSRRLGLAVPTPEQVAVVQAPLEPMLVVAGAGSGKTETMAARVVWLVENGLVQPGEVLALTFTRKAAAELSERIAARLRGLRRGSGADPLALSQDRPRVATYNAYAAALVRDDGLRLGVDPDARLLSEAGRWILAARLVERWPGDLAVDAAPTTVVGAVLELSAALAEHLLAPNEAAAELGALARALVEKDPAPSGSRRADPRSDVRRTAESLRARAELMPLVEAFAQSKKERGLLDFADQVAIACRIAREVPGVRERERARYRVVLLDEYQDTSVAQVALLSALFDEGHAVTAVGDPHQAIYGWRGASAGSVERFPVTFSRGGGAPAAVATLSTSWRNDHAILAAANAIAGPLRSAALAEGDERTSVELPVLVARPGADQGRVVAVYADTVDEEARVVARLVRDGRRAEGVGEPASAAVLCRTRAQMPGVAQALRDLGVPVEVVGLGGLLSTPEIADLHAALLVAHDPNRADAAMRLLTNLRLGVSDLAALYDRARELGHDGRPRDVGGIGDSPDAPTLVDAIERPPTAGWRSRSGRTMSQAGVRRVTDLGRVLRSVRAQSHLPLPELIGVTERLLRLDVDVLARPGVDARQARRHLDAFADVAADFAGGSEEPSLGAFLAWLAAAAERERGLDTTDVEVDPSAVQVMTVHAAKGLEWDVVAVVGLTEGAFPSYDGPVRDASAASAWLTALDALPYPLRRDAAQLPLLDVDGPSDHAAMAAEWADFRIRAGRHAVTEERRLVYVALTRARRVLVLSGSWWKEQAQQARPPSRFLQELRRAGAISHLPEPALWEPSATDNPLVVRPRTVTWPAAVPPGDADDARRSVAAVAEARKQLVTRERVSPHEGGPGSVDDPGGPDAASARARAWRRDVRLLLAERDEMSVVKVDERVPAHLSASDMVRLAQDPAAFALDRRRPVPTAPTGAARRGTRFHAWVERHFGAATLLGVEDLPGVDEFDLDAAPELDALKDAFLASPWAGRSPLAVEVPLETPVAGTMIRCRVDAVFPTDKGVQIVDWKTGPPPHDRVEAEARQIQLALYRLAWSRLHGIPLKSVQAAFYHVRERLLVQADPLTEDEILEVIRANPYRA